MDVSPVFRTAHDLRALAVADWSFVEHLKREHETVVDVRGVLPKLLSPLQPDRAQVREEILDHAAKLDQFEDLEVFAGQHLTSYSTLYSTAKSVAILDGIANGEPAFDRNAALDGWIARRPAAAELAHSIRALEPFFLRLRRRSEVSLPWTPVDDEPRLQRTVDLVRRFIRETS
jgi:hypothetical protein